MHILEQSSGFDFASFSLDVQYILLNLIELMSFSFLRIEKEKSQLKAELDDMQGQLDHVSKGKVNNIFYSREPMIQHCSIISMHPF